MCVRVGAIGGTMTSIQSINYETGEISLDSFSLTTETSLFAQPIRKKSTFYGFQSPTDTVTYAWGSICWNTQGNTATPDGWILRQAGWGSMT